MNHHEQHRKAGSALTAAVGTAAVTAAVGAAIVGALAWRRPEALPQVPVYPAHAPTVPADTDANRALRAFPDSLDGAARIEKYEIPGAAKVFVHIRQIHHTEEILQDVKKGLGRDPEATKLLRKQVDAIIRTQDGIERVLRSMAARGLLTAVCPEGYLTGHDKDKYLEWCTYSVLPEHTAFNDPRPMSEIIGESFGEITEGLGTLLGRHTTKRDTELLAYGATYQLVRDRLATAVPGETFEMNLRSVVMPTFTGQDGDRMDGRENMLLAGAVQGAEGPFAVGIMGGRHDFMGKKSASGTTWSSADYQERYDFNNFNAPKDAEYAVVDDQDDRVMYNANYRISAVRVKDSKDPEKWNWFGNQDNVAMWNRKHPDKKVSVIVITPEGYDLLGKD